MYLIAPDSFKDAASAQDIAHAIQWSIRQYDPNTPILLLPLSDGGEGWLQAILPHIDTQPIYCNISDPLFRPRQATYLWDSHHQTAYIEMAQAAGLEHLSLAERNPLYTTTLGVGQLIVHALDKGATQIILGLGGSATNDGGIGMAQALGFQFLDQNNNILPPIGKSLHLIHHINDQNIHPRLSQCHFIAACDVKNPLYGTQGAAQIYAPQKGATPAIVHQLDKGLQHLGFLLEQYYNKPINNIEGSGAAGGLGAGTIAFLNAQLQSGADILLHKIQFDQLLPSATHVFTGEGQLDTQSFQGKIIGKIIRKTSTLHIPTTIICGYNALPLDYPLPKHIHQIIALSNTPTPSTKQLTQTIASIRKLQIHI